MITIIDNLNGCVYTGASHHCQALFVAQFEEAPNATGANSMLNGNMSRKSLEAAMKAISILLTSPPFSAMRVDWPPRGASAVCVSWTGGLRCRSSERRARSFRYLNEPLSHGMFSAFSGIARLDCFIDKMMFNSEC
jgi:hypothetical protein